MDEFVEMVGDSGILLKVKVDNERAISFYRKYNFEVVKRLDNKIPLLLMRLN